MHTDAPTPTDGATISPSAVNEPADMVSHDILERIADRHARAVWGDDIPRGEPFEVADASYEVAAYAIPYIIGASAIPRSLGSSGKRRATSGAKLRDTAPTGIPSERLLTPSRTPRLADSVRFTYRRTEGTGR